MGTQWSEIWCQNLWLIYADSMSRSQFKAMGFALKLCFCSISPKPFEIFSINFGQMLISVKRCTEHMPQLPSLKVKVALQGHGIYPWISSLLPSKHAYMGPVWATHMGSATGLCMGPIWVSPYAVHEFHVRSISPEYFERFSWPWSVTLMILMV